MRLPDRSSGSTSPRFSRHSRSRAASFSPMMIRASEPPMKLRLLASLGIYFQVVHVHRAFFRPLGALNGSLTTELWK